MRACVHKRVPCKACVLTGSLLQVMQLLPNGQDDGAIIKAAAKLWSPRMFRQVSKLLLDSRQHGARKRMSWQDVASPCRLFNHDPLISNCEFVRHELQHGCCQHRCGLLWPQATDTPTKAATRNDRFGHPCCLSNSALFAGVHRATHNHVL